MTETITPALKWQYEQLLNEMLLLESHSADQGCSCETESEVCIRKHLLAIETYAQESVPLETDEELQTKLQQLVAESKLKRNAEERKLHGEDHGSAEGESEWVDAWRSQIIEDQGLAENHSEWVRGWRRKFASRGLDEPEIS
ncbi:hypothetical protein SAMN05660653_00526 [Desulfonatronum thiosulfatophilum]|uniref:Uncharacterized protein n=1 Tax=Desulfonatronum thiosulfatophilum TaxID=617002 RepID=A0A1G6ANS3_9BACT|nr:hypothetical protein [Desulfonatronum thiosulfatophilum]SDB10030.1 hypothetical protein SAMN05660653_00526 [Desulfonatronum thiosulfatophilum]